MPFRLPRTKEMLRREAANWLARLQSGRDPDIEEKFRQWQDADPRHAVAFGRVRRSFEQAGLLRHSPAFLSTRSRPSLRRRQWQARPAFVAAVIVLVAIGASLIGGGLPLGGTDALMLMTSTGEIRQVALADGSRVTLDTATKIDVEIGRTRRGAHLRYGRARFRVAPARAPFVVETSNATITTRQGVIDVEQGRVQVIAGAADVRGPDRRQESPVELRAGQSAIVNSRGAAKTAAISPGGNSWTRGMLQFDGTALADAVALSNRYSERHIILVGDLDALRVTGAFRAGDTAGFARALAAAFGLSLQQGADGNLILSPGAARGIPDKKGG